MAPKQTVPARRLPLFAAAGTAAVVLALALAGCGGDSDTSSAPQTTTAGVPATTPAPTTTSATTPAPETTTPSATPSADGQATRVTVTESDYKIQFSPTVSKPGTYAFVVKNAGQATHALEIEGPGLDERRSDTISSGASTTLTVTLQKGSYEVYCPVDGHRGLGMETEITVT
jgi:uncharacterized cupredoxin-like copper-binding protein